MKQIIQRFLYLIIVLLVLEVIKTIITKSVTIYAYPIGVVIASLQMLLVCGTVLIPLLFRYCKRIVLHSRKAKGLAVLLFVFIMGCLEGVCTFFLHHPDRLPYSMEGAFDYYYNKYGRSIIQFDKKASVYDPELFYTLKPDARFSFSNAEFDNGYRINRLGVRDDDSSLLKPAVICLGDSYSMGWGVEQDSTYPEELEHISHKKVLNTAISSYGTAREITLLHRFDTSALTHLVVQYYDNDIEENTDYLKNNHVLKVSPREKYDATVKIDWALSAYYPGKNFLNISQIYIKQLINKVVPVFPLTSGSISSGVTAESQAGLFLKVLGDAPVNFSTCKVIVFFPSKDFALSRAFEKSIDSLLHESPYKERFGNQVKLLKVSELLQPDDYYILDIHLRSSGHRKIAQGILNMMQAF
jgi:hypothetical protein